MFYTEQVTFLPVKPFDLHYYDRAEFNVKRINSFDFKVDLCQAECGTGENYESLITTETVMFNNSIASSNREYLFNDTRSIFVVRGSSIDITFTTEGDPNITLHMFNDTDQCESSSGLPYKSVNLTSSPHNFTAGSDVGEYLCIIVELSPNATFIYTVNAQIRQYRNVSALIASDLCSANGTHRFEDELQDHTYHIKFAMNRVPLDSVTLKSKETCLLLTITKYFHCRYIFCQFNVTSTLYATANNVKVIFLSVLTVFALLTACSIGIISFLCYKYR